MNTTIKPEHRANLETLAAGLLAHKEPPSLRMREYAYNSVEAITATKDHPCGSNTCMVGFGPSLGITPSKDILTGITIENKYPPFLWNQYSLESFGVEPLDDFHDGNKEEYPGDNSWHFLFDSNWPDSIEQGVHRINMYLKGTIPDDWRFGDEYSDEDYA